MRRHFVLAVLLASTALAAAQMAPGPQQQPLQPGAPQQQPGADPTAANAVPGAPPSFVPDVGAGDNMNAQPRVIRISGGVMAGNNISKVPPVYPDEARAAQVEGTVVMAAHIGRDGRVKNLAVVAGPQALQAAAVDAVKQWVYRPYMLNGAPVEVSTTITVNFHLH